MCNLDSNCTLENNSKTDFHDQVCRVGKNPQIISKDSKEKNGQAKTTAG